MDIVNELTAYEISLLFLDTKGAEVTPAAANYRVTDAVGAVIVASTPLSISGPTAQIMISADINVCVPSGKEIQTRRVVITAVGLAQIVHEYGVRRIK